MTAASAVHGFVGRCKATRLHGMLNTATTRDTIQTNSLMAVKLNDHNCLISYWVYQYSKFQNRHQDFFQSPSLANMSISTMTVSRLDA